MLKKLIHHRARREVEKHDTFLNVLIGYSGNRKALVNQQQKHLFPVNSVKRHVYHVCL